MRFTAWNELAQERREMFERFGVTREEYESAERGRVRMWQALALSLTAIACVAYVVACFAL